MNQDVVGMRCIDQVTVVAGQRLETGLCRFHENLRLVAGRPQRRLDPEHLIADRVAIAQCGQHLMHRRTARCGGAGHDSRVPSVTDAGPVGN